MSIQALILVGVQVSIFLTVLSIGLGTSVADLRHLLTQPALLARSLFVINILGPVVAIVVCKLFDLHPAVIVGLVTLAIAPVSNMFPKAMLPLVTPGRTAYVHGLFFASTLLSVPLTPLTVEAINVLFGGNHHVSPLAVANVVIGTVLLPLGAGLALARWRPSAAQWRGPIQKVSGVLLLLCAVIIIAAAWSVMGSLMRQGTLTAVALITLLGLAAGHVLGGPEDDDRTVLAHAAVSRHPGVAIAVASFTDERLAPVGVLLAVLLSAIAVAPYTTWRKRRRTGAPVARPAATGAR